MRRGYLVSLVTIGILLIIALGVMIAYTYFEYQQNFSDGTKTVGCLEITYESGSENISLTSSFLLSDSQGLAETPYKITVTNTCAESQSYYMLFNTLNVTNTTSDSNIKVSIAPIGSTDIKYLTGFKTYDLKNYLSISNLKESYIILSDTLSAGSTINYEAYVWLRSDADDDIVNRNMSATIDFVTIDNQEDISYYEISKDMVETISFSNSDTIPSNALGYYIVDGIYAWYFDENDDGLYDLVFGADGGVEASENSSGLFQDYTNLISIDFTNFFGTIIDASSMFENCTSLIEIDLSALDITSAQNLSRMFYNCESLMVIYMTTIDLTNIEYTDIFENINNNVIIYIDSIDENNQSIIESLIENVNIITI